MVRFTDAMLGNGDLSDTCKPLGPKEEQMRQFFLDRVRIDPLLDGQNYIYMHYADMISNGYHRLSPCPFQTQGIMLNPDGGMFFCENSEVVGNVLTEDAEEVYFKATSQEHRDWVKEKKCPSCLSPCQMNVSAVKQVTPYVKFLVRASNEKRKHRAKVAEAAAESIFGAQDFSFRFSFQIPSDTTPLPVDFPQPQSPGRAQTTRRPARWRRLRGRRAT